MGGDEAGDVDADGGEFGFGAMRRGGAGEPKVASTPQNDSANRPAPLGMTSGLGSVQTPVRPGTRFVGMAKSAQVRIRTSSRRRTNSITPRVLRLPSGRGESAEVEDGIADDLAGAVEGDVAAAVAFEEFDAALGEEFG